MSVPQRLAVLQDYAEEGWPSMDLVGQKIVSSVSQLGASDWQVSAIQPRFRHRFAREGNRAGKAFTADRLLNRMIDYPHHARSLARQHDVFHLADHSYSHLLHELPARRAVVSLHDLDTFTSILTPELETRSAVFRWMVRRIWSGLLKAGHVACVSQITREQLLNVAPHLATRSSVVYNGVDDIFRRQPTEAVYKRIDVLLGPKNAARPEILHVGSCIQRKRIDLMLNIFASVKATGVRARLIRVGPKLAGADFRLAESLGIFNDIVECCDLPLDELAAIYRRADLLLMTPDREGFGLPLIEALAAGTPVVARDIPILREVGGVLPAFFRDCTVEDARDLILQTLKKAREMTYIQDFSAGCLSWTQKFSWNVSASTWMRQYHQLAQGELI